MKEYIKALELIQASCKKVSGLEINITAEGVCINISNLYLEESIENIPKALKAIKTLDNLGANFG